MEYEPDVKRHHHVMIGKIQSDCVAMRTIMARLACRSPRSEIFFDSAHSFFFFLLVPADEAAMKEWRRSEQ